MSEIVFGITDSYLYEEKSIHPEHISKQIPDWYKKVPANIEKEYPFKYLNKTKTVKSCSSFINVFNNGYVIYAPTDIIIKYDDKTQTYAWEVSHLWNTMFERTEVIVSHSKNQMVDYVPSNAKDKVILKIHLPYTIFTDNGFSCIQMSYPYSYNNDWYVPYGIFDTDKIHEVNLQLIITTSNKEILIKQGTPLAIYIPFKRQSYKLNIVDMNTNKKYIQRFKKYYIKLNGAFKYTVNKLKGTQ